MFLVFSSVVFSSSHSSPTLTWLRNLCALMILMILREFPSVLKSLTEDQKLAIFTVFAEELAKNIKLTKQVICEKIASNNMLKDLTSCPSSIKKVANYLSYQQRRSPDRPHPPSSTFTRVGKWVSALEETASRVSLREV